LFSGTADFNPDAPTDNKTTVGSTCDIFLTKINADGSYGGTKHMGGAPYISVESMTIANSDNIYLAGIFLSTADFDPGVGTDNKTSAGQYDIFLTKINSNETYGWTKTFGGTTMDFFRHIAIDNVENIFITGEGNGTIDFDPGDAVVDKTMSATAAYVSKFKSDGSFVWVRLFGDSSIYGSYCNYLALDCNDKLYLTGYFRNIIDLDPGPGIDNKTSAGGDDIFLIKLSR